MVQGCKRGRHRQRGESYWRPHCLVCVIILNASMILYVGLYKKFLVDVLCGFSLGVCRGGLSFVVVGADLV